MYIIIEKRDKCIYPKISVLNVLLSNCLPRPAPERLLPYKAFHSLAQLFAYLSSSALAISNPYKGTKIIKIYLSQMSLGISETINPMLSSPTRTFTSYQSVIGLIHVTY